MPSLRRTISSSPVVRANPYPTSLSSSHNTHLTMGLLRPRRTASDTISRRVLADIEWWRVLDGQHQEDPDFEQEQEVDIIEIVQDGIDVMGVAFDVQPASEVVNLDSATSRLSTPVDQNVFELNAGSHAVSSRAELTISAIAPSTPTRNRGSRRGSSGDSSTESTPEPDFPDFHARFLDEDILDTVPSIIHHSHLEVAPSCSMSLSELTVMSNIEDRFGDVAIAL